MEQTDQQLMMAQPRPILVGSTHGENLTSMGIRSYTLNRQQALDNELQNCQSEHLQHVMKAGKNLVFNSILQLSNSSDKHCQSYLLNGLKTYMLKQQIIHTFLMLLLIPITK